MADRFQTTAHRNRLRREQQAQDDRAVFTAGTQVAGSSSGGGGGEGAGYDEGAAFPLSPGSGDKFYRTDLNMLCFFDGTRWMSVNEYSINSVGAQSESVSGTHYLGIRQDYPLFLTSVDIKTFTSPAPTGSSYWEFALHWRTLGNVDTELLELNNIGDLASNWTDHQQIVNAVLDPTAVVFRFRWSKFGSPGAIYCPFTIRYRLIVT